MKNNYRRDGVVYLDISISPTIRNGIRNLGIPMRRGEGNDDAGRTIVRLNGMAVGVEDIARTLVMKGEGMPYTCVIIKVRVRICSDSAREDVRVIFINFRKQYGN